MALIDPPATKPAGNYEEAQARAHAVMSRDDDTIAPNAHTKLLVHDGPTPLSVVLFHGLTNHPGQYVDLAPLIHDRGANVYVPRMPYQGYKNRLTNALAKLTAEELIAAAYDAVDIARGLGERVAVLGISAGGLQCAYLAQYRDDVALSIPVAPDFAILQLSHGVTMSLAWLIDLLPNMFLWWDPRIREAQRPRTAYPRFPTHALMQTIRIADDVFAVAKRRAPRAGQITTVVNRADPAVNNEVTKDVVTSWRGNRRSGIDLYEFRSLPENHDIIDPDNPNAKTELVYPKLLELLGLA